MIYPLKMVDLSIVMNGYGILVGGDWNTAFMTFHSVGNVIIPTDKLIFFRGVDIPPTRI
jgi:hypothetical protein